ncbi:hypothetical protein M413DRAFT_448240 [Hebeloma cylindrosporum]|uniref:Uncharacterized protein n=1 Tax=Hebeloma cylindrosporum TaxID=76867 RepID=A0A0C2XIT4_HEBCY|nr:hypothetical protein M413DRAFT_448240 [Hebeloma cylindrosporum h7]
MNSRMTRGGLQCPERRLPDASGWAKSTFQSLVPISSESAAAKRTRFVAIAVYRNPPHIDERALKRARDNSLSNSTSMGWNIVTRQHIVENEITC